MSRKISRRSLLSYVATATGVAALTACGGAAPQGQAGSVAPTAQPAAKTAATAAPAATTAPAGAATAAPQAAAGGAPVTLRLGWWIAGQTQWYKIMQKAMDSFSAQNPTVKVQLESSPWADYWQRIQVQMAGGNGPDLQWTSGAYFAKLYPQGAYLDLTSYVNRDHFDYSQYVKQDDFFPGGKVYTMPYSGWGGKLLSYNEAAFDEAGVKYPDKSWTWDDLLTAAQKLTKRDGSGKVTQWGLFIDPGAEYGFLSYMRHNGANWIDDQHTKTTMDSPEAIEAIQWIDDAINKHKVAPGKSETDTLTQAGITAPFEGGRAAMRSQKFDISLFMDQKPPATLRPNVELFPTIHGKKRWGNGNTNPMTAAKYTKHPEEAWKALLYLAGPESMQLLLSMRNGNTSVYMPLNQDSKVGWMQPVPNLPNLKLDVYIEALSLWTGLDFHPKWAEWDTAIEKEIGFVYLGQKRAPEACQSATQAGNQALASG